MVMTKEEFKTRWESDDTGGGITYEDVANCAEAWGLFRYPKRCNIDRVLFEVLKEAQVNNYMDFDPDKEDSDD